MQANLRLKDDRRCMNDQRSRRCLTEIVVEVFVKDVWAAEAVWLAWLLSAGLGGDYPYPRCTLHRPDAWNSTVNVGSRCIACGTK